MKILTFFVLFSAIICLIFAEGEESHARLLVSKNILNNHIVEGKDLVVQYSIHNVGGSTALNVKLTDASFPETEFKVHKGSLNVHWNRITAGANVTHTAVVRPLVSGSVNLTSAEVSYSAFDEAPEPTVGYTSFPGLADIMALRDFERKFSPHYLDWAAFVIMTLPSLGIPYLLWRNSHSKYEHVSKKKSS